MTLPHVFFCIFCTLVATALLSILIFGQIYRHKHPELYDRRKELDFEATDVRMTEVDDVQL